MHSAAFSPLLSPLFASPAPPSSSSKSKISPLFLISCGPRDSRGPLLRGRILSTEAILAIQSIKRSAARNPPTSHLHAAVSKTLSRLIKPDLLAALRELLRQDHCHLALIVLSSARREPWYRPDYGLYAEIISALARNGMNSEIDQLVSELVDEGFYAGDSRGLARLLKSLVAVEHAEALVDVYGLMKRGACVMDEYMFKVLSKGLRKLGKFEAAEEVEKFGFNKPLLDSLREEAEAVA